VVLAEGQRREVLTVQGRGDAELVPIDQVLAGLGVTMTNDTAGGAVTLTYQKHEVALYNRKSLVSVGGDLRLLSAPVILDQGKWLVPLDALPRLIGPLLGIKVDWRASARVLVLGGTGIPHVNVSAFLTGDVARVVFEASEKVPFRVQQEEGRVTVSVARDLVDAAVQQDRLSGGIVDQIQFLGGRDNLFAITVGKRFQQMKAFEQEQPPRLVLDFQASASAAGPLAPAARAPASARATITGMSRKNPALLSPRLTIPIAKTASRIISVGSGVLTAKAIGK
jgi:hypothetical protein